MKLNIIIFITFLATCGFTNSENNSKIIDIHESWNSKISYMFLISSQANLIKISENVYTQTESPSEDTEKLTENKESTEKDYLKGLFNITYQFDLLSIGLAIAMMLLIMLLYFYFSKEDSVYSYNSSSSIDKEWVIRKIKEANQNRQGLNQGMSSYAITTIEERIKKIESELISLRLKIESMSIPFEVVSPGNEEQSWPEQETKQSEIKTQAETFFLSTPNSDGSFNERSASYIYKEGASIFKFVKTSSNRARFQIDEREASLKLALQYPDKNIDPVCDALNTFDPKAKRIITIEPGEVEFGNEKWVKVKKAKIRYES